MEAGAQSPRFYSHYGLGDKDLMDNELGLAEWDYDREKELRQKFNSFIQGLTGISMDYYAKLSIEEFERYAERYQQYHHLSNYS